MKYLPLAMIRDHMEQLPVFACPSAFRIRTFAPGDERQWARIETLAGEFQNEVQALLRFEQDYGSFRKELEDRCFLLEDSQGQAIGTATAWHGHFAGSERGQVGWVGIVPAYQGRKLAKPLLSAVMARLGHDHSSAYLGTQTTSYRAVNLYLNFGFVPYFMHETCQEGWSLMEQALGRQIL